MALHLKDSASNEREFNTLMQTTGISASSITLMIQIM